MGRKHGEIRALIAFAALLSVAGGDRTSTLSYAAMALFSRVRPLALSLLVAALALPALAQDTPRSPATAPIAVEVDRTPWLYKGSDIPHDPEWRFGTLPNGLRYAVRKNGVPPGQVAIRLRMDVGALMEGESEKGFAHLLEHLSFRGSSKVPDGESKRVWQRLGVTFGSDSNATTSPVSTTYKLDLPDANEASLDQSMMILADMMAAPGLTAEALTAERPVVLAEQRERLNPQSRFEEAQRNLFFAGQLFAERPVIGTVETLNGATAESVKAFHQRWYRPERATLVIVGDMDPALFERMIAKHFAPWQGVGPNPATPDFGKPTDDHPKSAAIVEPTLPPVVSMAVLRPWTVFEDTIIFNQERMVDFVAMRIINRRLESRARAGSSYIGASADLSDALRSANITAIQVLPIGEDWETAVKEVRGVIADALANAPTQSEIDREVAEIDSQMRNSIATAPVTPRRQSGRSNRHQRSDDQRTGKLRHLQGRGGQTDVHPRPRSRLDQSRAPGRCHPRHRDDAHARRQCPDEARRRAGGRCIGHGAR